MDSEVSWPEQGIDILHNLGFKTAAMALNKDSVRIDDPRLLSEEKLAVILGTEGDGLVAGTIAACDYTVRIPMSHGVDSLNVVAASAINFNPTPIFLILKYKIVDRNYLNWYQCVQTLGRLGKFGSFL